MREESERLQRITDTFLKVRENTLGLVKPLTRDDYMVQSTDDSSPPKWHLAHTTWFFERFILRKYHRIKTPYDRNYDFLFNSYYETLGNYLTKSSRKNISRPSMEEVMEYRKLVDERVVEVAGEMNDNREMMSLLELGINHEEQHQELLLMDIKMNYYSSPYHPAYHAGNIRQSRGETVFVEVKGGMVEIGYGGNSFSFDNERPMHHVFLNPFRIASRPVTNEEFIRFIEDGGYLKPQFWLSDGWIFLRQTGRDLPLYWSKDGDDYRTFTLSGERTLDRDEPVSHVTYYEADAFARWSGMRLPREEEWEQFEKMNRDHLTGNFMEDGSYTPRMNGDGNNVPQIEGSVWEWTSSSYSPYPGYRPYEGNLGEYNGKFMNNQYVLRGGSAVTPARHYRNTYRNFYHPESSWEYSGIRLAGDLK